MTPPLSAAAGMTGLSVSRRARILVTSSAPMWNAAMSKSKIKPAVSVVPPTTLEQARAAGADHGAYDRERGACPDEITPCMGVDTPGTIAEYTAAYRGANPPPEAAPAPTCR